MRILRVISCLLRMWASESAFSGAGEQAWIGTTSARMGNMSKPFKST